MRQRAISILIFAYSPNSIAVLLFDPSFDPMFFLYYMVASID